MSLFRADYYKYFANQLPLQMPRVTAEIIRLTKGFTPHTKSYYVAYKLYRMNHKRHYLIYLPVVLIAVLLCVRVVHEPDLWWQLRTGEYILQNGEVPNTDVFSFTYDGKPWLNVKWGFEVIQASIVKAFGPEALPLPQMAANLFMLLLLFGLMRALPKTQGALPAVKALALLLFLVGMSYRMNGRPELVSYTFTAFYVFIYTQFWRGKRGWIFALLPAQLLWANLHEGYGTGMVMSGIFLFSLYAENALAPRKERLPQQQRFRATAVVAASWLIVALHPGGLQMIWHSYEIFTQLTKNQFTQEIYSAANRAYWQWPAFFGLAVGAVAAFQLYKTARQGGKFNLQNLRSQYPLFYVLIFAAFFYLSLKSYRNLPFLLIASTPIMAAQLQSWLGFIASRKLTWVVAVVAIAFYISIGTNLFYRTFLPAEEFGWAVSARKNPIQAAKFINENKLSGPAFSDYLNSSYLLWHLQPEFKTFVDLRDLDVFEADDIEISLICCNYPERRVADGRAIWEVIDARYTFTYVVLLNQPEFLPLHHYLAKGNTFKLVYVDALSAIFVRNTPAHAALIANAQADLFKPTPPLYPKKFAQLFWPFYSPINQTPAEFEAVKQSYFTAIGRQSR
jgi:hypothetical protein